MNGLRIGRLARLVGVNIETLRYYERQGLIDEPPRTASNYRLYPRDTVRRVRFIKRAQALGFTLGEIREFLSLRAAPRVNRRDVRRRAERKIAEIDAKVRLLREMRRSLSGLVAECSGRKGTGGECPILDAIDSEKDFNLLEEA